MILVCIVLLLERVVYFADHVQIRVFVLLILLFAFLCNSCFFRTLLTLLLSEIVKAAYSVLILGTDLLVPSSQLAAALMI